MSIMDPVTHFNSGLALYLTFESLSQEHRPHVKKLDDNIGKLEGKFTNLNWFSAARNLDLIHCSFKY